MKRKPRIGRRHVWIPDTQCREGENFDHLTAAGNYILDKRPDVLVHLGDHWDMESLSSYDRGKKRAEGKRVHLDINAGARGMNALLEPMMAHNRQAAKWKKAQWKPEEMHFLYGNHEGRITKHVEANPELDGYLSLDHLGVEKWGWTAHEFLKVLELDGIWFSHYFYQPKTGKPYGGMISTKLKNVGNSFVQGHTQGLDSGIMPLANGQVRRGVVAGSFYRHNEHYRGPQAVNEWRGILYATEIKKGNFNLCEVSLPYLMEKWV